MANARWAKERARREAEEPERMMELAAHPSIMRGDAIGVLQWHDLRTGQVRRWRVLRGNRIDQVVLEFTAIGKRTGSHGWTWVMDHLRGYLAGTKVSESDHPGRYSDDPWEGET